MRRRDFVWPATLAALTSCVKKPASGLTSIEFGVQPYPNAAIIYLALERGYFRDAGFDVHLRVVTGASNISAAVVEGRLDAGTYSSSPGLFNAVARGARVRLVLGREIVNASCGDAAAIYARKKAFPKGTSDIRQWDGKRFATIGSRAGMDSFFLDTMLARAGLDPAKTPRFTLNHAQAVAAMIAGSMDAMVNGSPLPVAVDRAEIVRELAGARAIEPLQYSFICFGSRLLDAGTSIGARLLAAYLRAGKDFLAGATPQYLKDYVASNGLDESVLKGCRATFSLDGTIDMKSLKTAVDWGIARGFTDAGVSAEALVDRRFLELAHREAV